MKTALIIFGAGVAISVISAATSSILHLTGKSELDSLFSMVASAVMLCLLLFGILHGLAIINDYFLPGYNPFGAAADLIRIFR
ncbi:MAG: hypothetical protein JL56_04565 [Desulfotomaculum sp. BICA1-6]|nr:MAG: hypothetical protein JL56_04565 [Desulfotomaculum sp. BICA1-6]